MDKTIGIIGLGRCGMPAAKRFIEHGFTVYGHARRPEVIEAFTALGGIPRRGAPLRPIPPPVMFGHRWRQRVFRSAASRGTAASAI